MYHNSSQKRFWLFENEASLEKLRYDANQKFRSKIMSSGKVGCALFNVNSESRFVYSLMFFI